MPTPIKFYAIKYQNGLTFYAKGASILECVALSKGMCGRVIDVRHLTPEEYSFRMKRQIMKMNSKR